MEHKKDGKTILTINAQLHKQNELLTKLLCEPVFLVLSTPYKPLIVKFFTYFYIETLQLLNPKINAPKRFCK
jgi:hypothetical protein